MKHLDINEESYVHIQGNNVYVYVNNEFIEMLYIDDAENMNDPIPYILDELEVVSRVSLFQSATL